VLSRPVSLQEQASPSACGMEEDACFFESMCVINLNISVAKLAIGRRDEQVSVVALFLKTRALSI
jgi:hypothetical protein